MYFLFTLFFFDLAKVTNKKFEEQKRLGKIWKEILWSTSFDGKLKEKY